MIREVEENVVLQEKRFERWAEKSPRFEQWRKDIEQRALDAITSEKVWTLTGFREGGAALFPNEHPLEFRAVTLLWEHSGGKKYDDRVAATLYRPSSRNALHLLQDGKSYSSRLYRIAKGLLKKEPPIPLELTDLLGMKCADISFPAEQGQYTL